MQERASQESVRKSRMRRALSRGLFLLGGVVAGTAAAWLLSSATAAADTFATPTAPGVDHAVHRTVDGVEHAARSAVDPQHLADSDAAPRRAGQRIADAGTHLRDAAAHAVDTTVHGAVSTLSDPQDAARDAASGAKSAFGHLRTGWRHFAGAVTPAIPAGPAVDRVVAKATTPAFDHTIPSPGTATGNGFPTIPEPVQAAQDVAGSAPASSPERSGDSARHVDSPRLDVSTHSSGRGGHEHPCAPAHQPEAPALAPAGSGTGGQCNSGGSNGGVAVTTPGDILEPGTAIARGAGFGASIPSGQPGRQPGCTPD